MKISSLKIQNFKTFDAEGILLSITDLTAFIGENNTGKSNILEALDLFFNFSKTKMSKQSFHHDDVTKEIIIEVKFTDLTDNELKKFNIHLDENKELTITQKIKIILPEYKTFETLDEDEYEFEEEKHGTKWEATEDWAKLGSKAPTKTNIKAWWKKELKIGDFNFKGLFDDSDEPTPETYQEKLQTLWDEHFDIIPKEKVVGDEKVLGWKNKLKGNLPKYFYVPAVKNIEDDLKCLKTNPFGEMINWLTDNISDDIKKDFTEKTEKIISDALEKIDKDEDGSSKIRFINDQLNTNLGINLDCKLELKFGKPKISDIVFPSPQLFADDGYYSEITYKGHGLQRLAILSLLRTYNGLKKRTDRTDRNMILAIEEPEIYLHPPVKRATYKLLRRLSEGTDQVIYSTHDGFFVSVEHFDEIRMFRRFIAHKPKTHVYEFSIKNLVEHYKNAYKKDVDEKSLRHRFSHICDESKNEAFFAKKVIIIEGETEKYSLPIYFNHKSFDIDNERITIISAGSADNISYLYVIFNEFHIPCYIIFDGDKPEKTVDTLDKDKKDDAQNKSRRNKELLAFVGEKIDEKVEYCFPATTLKTNYAVWEKDFEHTFHKSLDNYEELKGKATKFYGTTSKPLAGRFFASVLTTEAPEKINPYIDNLIEKIKALEWKNSCLCSER